MLRALEARIGRLAPTIVGSLFVLSNGLNLALFGPRLGGDSSIYLDAARTLVETGHLDGRAASYPAYVAVLALLQLLHLPPFAVVGLQLAAAAAGLWAIWRLAHALGGLPAAFIAGALWAAYPEQAKWNAYVLTDSLYISMVPVAAYAIHRAAERSGRAYLAALAVVALAGALRPNGWVLVPIAIAYWIIRAWRHPARYVVGTLTGLVAFAVVMTTLSGGAIKGREPDVMMQRGEVIWNYPEARLAMPDERPPAHHGFGATLRYLARHPASAIRLCALRVWTEVAHTRPFNSPLHNLLCLALWPLYAALALALARRRSEAMPWLLLAIVGAHLAIVAISYADWDGRFLVYVLPCILPLGAAGFASLLPAPAAVTSDPPR
jgi:hypothetical protein